MTHAVSFHAYRSGRKSMAECGEYVDANEISTSPTCLDCQRELAKSAEDMFGSEPPGTPVAVTYFDPLQGYTPKGSHR